MDRRAAYSVGIICALPIEKAAVEATLNEEHQPLRLATGDENDYGFGKIGEHHVVVACLPAGVTGTVSAAVVARDMKRSFPIRIGLMVGIGGGVWSEKVDVRLGDVIVSQPDGQHGGVVQWDFGKTEAGGVFRRTGTLNKPPRELLNAVQSLKVKHLRRGNELDTHLKELLRTNPTMEEGGFVHQGQGNDILFMASYDHQIGDTCEKCERSYLVQRRERQNDRPRIHYGNIASGDQVMEDGKTRDRIAEQEGVICFEMEAAGLMDTFPCVVIRGVCDYADSHKNKRWQPYAAATAAAYAKELLLLMRPAEVAKLQTAAEATQSSPPRIVYIPFAKNHQFVGRDTELHSLEQRLFTARDCQKMAVAGLGGIGKTQLVLRFAYTIVETRPDTSIFWIPALSFDTFERAFEDIARHVGIQIAANSGQDVKELVKRHLSTPSAGKWLLIVDNADDMDVLNTSAHSDGLLRFLPESTLGVTVFTTRTSRVAQRLVGSDVLKVEKLQQNEADKLLEKALVRTDLLHDDPTATALLVELDYLPLAITQAAAYININDISIAEYLQLLRSTPEDIVHLLSEGIYDSAHYGQSTSAVATTWFVSFEQIIRQNRIAADLLEFIACIEWKAIPKSILPTVQPAAQLVSAIGTLGSYSFLSKREGEPTYDMHRLVHLASRIWLRENHRTVEVQKRAVAHLATSFPKDDYANRMIWRAYLGHVTELKSYLLEADADADADKQRSWLFLKVGQCLRFDGRTRDALQWLSESSRLRSNLAEDHPDRLGSQHALAVVYLFNGRTEDAVRLLEHVVAIHRERALAEDHPDRLGSQHALAAAYLFNGRTEDAVRLLEHVVAIHRERALAEDHPSRLGSQHALAAAYLFNGRTEDAVRLLEHVVAIRETALAEDHPSRLASQHALAAAYESNGRTKSHYITSGGTNEARLVPLVRQALCTRRLIKAKDAKGVGRIRIRSILRQP